MSWDVVILALPPGTRSFNDLPKDYDASLATISFVHSTLRELFPDINLTDPAWGVLVADTYSMEFNIGSEDPCRSIMLHIRGDEASLTPIRALCERTGWGAFDTSDGALMDFSADPGKGLRAWRAYREQVAPGSPERGVSVPIAGGGQVFVDSLGPPPAVPKPKRWWQFWK